MSPRLLPTRSALVRATIALIALVCCTAACPTATQAAEPPAPLLAKGKPVDWWFVFKLNSTFARCGGTSERSVTPACPFGGKPQTKNVFGQQFVFAHSGSKQDRTLKQGKGCLGQSTDDPVGATFEQIYKGRHFFVVWNDDFHGFPPVRGCGGDCKTEWGHSKGILAWDDSGRGVVMQVTTPSWPGAGSVRIPRKGDGNTLGCIKSTNNVLVSQHFFAVRLDKNDVVLVLKALANASVPTDVKNPQLVDNGGPPEIVDAVNELGKKSPSTIPTRDELSTKVILISKPSKLNVPPWQMVSAVVEEPAVALRSATWWMRPEIFTTTASQKVTCWSDGLNAPGPVEIALTGHWMGKEFGLRGHPSKNSNHAKIGVSRDGERYAIFGDMNQQGSAKAPDCKKSQNGRGGLFYAVKDETLHESVKLLIEGETARSTPTK